MVELVEPVGRNAKSERLVDFGVVINMGLKVTTTDKIS